MMLPTMVRKEMVPRTMPQSAELMWSQPGSSAASPAPSSAPAPAPAPAPGSAEEVLAG